MTTVVLVWIVGSILVALGLGRVFRNGNEARIEAAKRGKWVVYEGKRRVNPRRHIQRRAN